MPSWEFQLRFSSLRENRASNGYINFPSSIAQAMEFERGETVEWFIEDKGTLALKRLKVPPSVLKKKQME